MNIGISPAAKANRVTTILLMIAKKKLLPGEMIKLDITIGMKKINEDLPAESCSGVSLNIDPMIKRVSRRKAAILLERLFMKKTASDPNVNITMLKSKKNVPGFSK